MRTRSENFDYNAHGLPPSVLINMIDEISSNPFSWMFGFIVLLPSTLVLTINHIALLDACELLVMVYFILHFQHILYINKVTAF